MTNVVGGPLTFDELTNVGQVPWTQFTHTFTTLPGGSAPTISFIARNDPAYFGLDDLVVTPSLVTKKPVFTSADHTTFTAGTPGSFTVSTTVDAAHGTATLSCPSCVLPSGVSFTPGPGGTATIAGLVGSDGGIWPITIQAKNSVGTTDQQFTLTVRAPAITVPTYAPAGDGLIQGVQLITIPGSWVTWTGTGYAPDAPVTLLSYPASTYAHPTVLGIFDADNRGTVSMHAYVPANISGIQYLVAGGYQSLTRIRYLTGQTDVRALRRA